MREQFYGDPETLDLQKMREDAERKLKNGEQSIIHHHKWQQDCEGKQHEYFPPRDGNE